MAIDRAIFVTGAASGIGLAATEAILGAKGSVIAADRDEAALATLRARYGDELHCELLDITSDDEIPAAIDRGIAALGPLGGVVNSAGTGRDIPAFDTESGFFRQILDINIVGNFLVAREAARRMSDAGGSIVNITSVSGIRGNAGRAAYGASKGGVDALTRILAVEWAQRAIRVNAVAPGPIDTPLAQRVHSAEVRQQWCSMVPMARYGNPQEVVGAILFLLDNSQSSYVTGQTISVDGGFTVTGLRPAAERI